MVRLAPLVLFAVASVALFGLTVAKPTQETIKLETPQQYTALLRGELDRNADYEVSYIAKPANTFGDIKDWVCYSTAFRSLKTTDKYGNFIRINPSTRTVEADLSKGGHYTFDILPMYEKYTVHLRTISAQDVRRIHFYLRLVETAKEIVVHSDEKPKPAIRKYLVRLMAEHPNVKFYGPNSETVSN